MDRLITVYSQWVEDTIQFTQDGKMLFIPENNLRMEYHAVNKKGLYSLELKEWRKKTTAYKNWASFKQVFVEEYHNLEEKTKVNSGDEIFHSENAMREIGGALEHLYMAVVADTYITTNLTEAVESQTKKMRP